MTPADAQLLRSPCCAAELAFGGRLRGTDLDTGELRCRSCRRRWPVVDGIPELVEDGEVRGFERLIRHVYDLIAPFHDLGVRFVLPAVMFMSEDEARDRYVRRLELDGLGPRRARILDVGIGGGGNLPPIVRRLRPDAPIEVWGLDYSRGMLDQCRRRLRGWEGPPVHLVGGDAHALPFPDASFDRVLHVGGIATYRDPARALAEMSRVAKPGTPVVVVDEQLDARAAHSWYQWLAFKALTVYDLSPHAPVEHLPATARDVRVEQASSFYYCLTFRPAPSRDEVDETGVVTEMPGPRP